MFFPPPRGRARVRLPTIREAAALIAIHDLKPPPAGAAFAVDAYGRFARDGEGARAIAWLPAEDA